MRGRVATAIDGFGNVTGFSSEITLLFLQLIRPLIRLTFSPGFRGLIDSQNSVHKRYSVQFVNRGGNVRRRPRQNVGVAANRPRRWRADGLPLFGTGG
jgi:hypothetical protein